MSWLFDQSGHLDWRWIATTVVALYAAIVATYREYAMRRERLVKVRVILSTNLIALIGTQTFPQVQVRVENHGRPDLTFDSNCASVEWFGADNTRLLLWDVIPSVPAWPHRLVSGASFYLMAPTQPLRDILTRRQVSHDTKL